MADSKDLVSVFRPLHHEAFIEPPYHEWMQGQRDKAKLDAEAKVRADAALRKLKLKEEKEAEIRRRKEEETHKEEEEEILREKFDPQRIPSMNIDPANPKLPENNVPDPDIYLVHIDQFKASNGFPKFPDRTVKLREININNSLLVFLSHAWIQLPGRKINRRMIRKPKVEKEKVDISGFYFDGVVDESSDEEEVISRPTTPDQCSKSVTIVDTFVETGQKGGKKWKLYCEALDHMLKEFAPDMFDVYIWMDYCCVPQPEPLDPKDPDVTLGQRLNEMIMKEWKMLCFDRIMTYMDCMLTCILDDDYIHDPWTLKNSGEGLHKDYANGAKNWKRYLSRRWCRTEMSYAAFIPFPHEDEYQHHAVFDRKMNPLLGRGVMRADRLAGGVQYERLQSRRAHLIYGTRESVLKLPPKVLPALTLEVLNSEYNPMEGEYSRYGDAAILERLNRELWPFTRKGEAGYVGERDNWGAVGQVGRRHGQGKMSYPNGNYYEGAWYQGHMEGKGVYQHNNGDGNAMDIYEGVMKGSKQHGHNAGTYKRWDGASYRGDWEMGIRHGIGTFTWPDGSTYRGYWENDERHGFGDLVLSSGAKFSGFWARGKRNGSGIMKWPDGSFYDGEWKRDKRHGNGTYWTPYARGHLYTGEWVDGMKEGRGKLQLGGGVEDHNNDFQTQTEWLSGQDLDSQILDGYFQGGNFIEEIDHAGEDARLTAEASVAFEIDSDEERRLEEESAAATEKRLKMEYEESLKIKNLRNDPNLLVAATEKLAEAARRRRAIRNGEDVEPLPLDDISELGDDDPTLTVAGSSTNRSGGSASHISQLTAESGIPSIHLSSRRPSHSTPRADSSPYTPRPEESIPIQKIWNEIDLLEETDFNDRATLQTLSQKYSDLSELYSIEGKDSDSIEAQSIANEYLQLNYDSKSIPSTQAYNDKVVTLYKADGKLHKIQGKKNTSNAFELSDSEEDECDDNTAEDMNDKEIIDATDSWEKREVHSRKNSLKNPIPHLTPRQHAGEEVQNQWQIIDDFENTGLNSAVDFFHLSRHYSILSDLYKKQEKYIDALEVKKRSIECISGFVDFPRKASQREKEYYAKLNNDCQILRERIHAKDQKNKAHNSALVARREIAKILYPDHPAIAEAKKVEDKNAMEKYIYQEKILPADEYGRDKSGYKVNYPHDP